MAETWGNGHYSCYGCSEQSNKDSARCRGCFTYTPLMQPYYKNWTQEKKQTNADRIRAMSDAELEDLIVGLNEHCLAGIGKADCSSCGGYCEDNCRRMTAKWLQSEVEE